MIDKSKTYRTRDGREVRIYATDGGGHKPIHGAIRQDESWVAYTWLYDGVAALDCNSLIEVKPRIKIDRWVNVYDDGHVSLPYETEQKAHSWSGGSAKRIACVKLTIDCEEGEGL